MKIIVYKGPHSCENVLINFDQMNLSIVTDFDPIAYNYMIQFHARQMEEREKNYCKLACIMQERTHLVDKMRGITSTPHYRPIHIGTLPHHNHTNH